MSPFSALKVTLASSCVAAVLCVGGIAHAITSERCLALKRQAHGNLHKCRAGSEAKALQGKPGNVEKCTAKFQTTIAKLDQKASDAGIPCRYRDNGDGTISDYDTGLQWEKKDGADAQGVENLADPHDVDNRYTWNTSPGGAAPNGTAFTDFLGTLNACATTDTITVTGGFAGHCDWRLPTVAELRSILLEPFPCETSPCIDPTLGPIQSVFPPIYWSATASDGNLAYTVDFGEGLVSASFKINAFWVRAVRNGM